MTEKGWRVRKDKQKVVGEPMTDEQIAVFLSARPYAGESTDQYILTRAYRGLRAHDFERFVEMFGQAGFDLDAPDTQGRTFLQNIRDHAQAQDYVAALERAGAH